MIGALLLCLALSGCAERASPATATSAPPDSPTDAAAALLATAVLPPGAKSSDSVVAKGAEAPACMPLDHADSNWFVSGATVNTVAAFLEANPTGTLTDVSHGRATAHGEITSEFVTDEKDGASTMLVFTFQPATSGVDLRVDAEVVPKGSNCVGNQPAVIG